MSFKPHIKGDFAVTDGEDDVVKLSVDSKQELTIDPRTVGLDSQDELDITYIAKKQSYYTTFPWTGIAASNTLLWNCVVDPGLHRKSGDEIFMTAACFASHPFAYWRGSMEYRFQVVCSNYHKGRLRVTYDPVEYNPGEENVQYTNIIDISNTTDFTIKVGWGQTTSYARCIALNSANTDQSNTTALTYSSTSGRGNGVISVEVLNELTSPSTVTNIEVNVFVRACDDFEVAVPITNLSSIRWLEEGSSPPSLIEPQSEEQQIAVSDESPTIDTIANTIEKTDYTNFVFFGESLRSFRQMLKRYNQHEFIPFVDGTTGQYNAFKYVRPMLPFSPGYTNYAAGSSVTEPLTDGNYAYAHMTLLTYVTRAFAGWRGSTRWLVLYNGEPEGVIGITRGGDKIPEDTVVKTPFPLNTPAKKALINEFCKSHTGTAGSVFQHTAINALVGAEVPYYSPLRFTSGRRATRFALIGNSQPSVEFSYEGMVDNTTVHSMSTFVCAGEDFNCFFYVGPPRCYVEMETPSS
jgi:hypothetical protein